MEYCQIIIIPDIKIIQRNSTIFQKFHFNFWKSMQFLTIFLVLIHFNQIYRDFMIILKYSKVILTFST
jgi:hypothetical protein